MPEQPEQLKLPEQPKQPKQSEQPKQPEIIDKSKPSKPAKPEVLFIHQCCGAGVKFFNAWNAEHNPDGQYKVNLVSILNAKEQGLDKKYGFEINELNKFVYIVVGTDVIKGDK